MKKTDAAGEVARDLAAERLSEIKTLSRQMSDILAQMIADIDKTSGVFPKPILDKLNQLHASHLQVLKAEDAFHDRFEQDPDAESIDFDAIRIELGRQLDRLRACKDAERVSGKART